MKAGIAALFVAYVLSQFYRAFLAVLTPVLIQDLDLSAADLASASGWWFLAFAAMQIPIGSGLDRWGPRWTATALMAVGAVGALLFALANGAFQINLAMALIGVGCAPVLMASYYIFARTYSPAVFGTLAGITIGVGSLGNIAASLPLAAAVEAFGWRNTVFALAAITAVTTLAVGALVRDPARVETTAGGSLLDLLKMPALWPILLMMAVCYPAPSGLRGLWVGPWYADVFGADAAAIGQVTLIMGLAMVAGNLAYGPMERLLGTRKGLVAGGNALMLGCLLGLYACAATPGWIPVALLAGVGFFGASFPIVMAHGRAFLPPHLLGRGVTLINLFGIGSAGLMQMVTGQLHRMASQPSAALQPSPEAPYAMLFLFYAGLTLAGLLIYLQSQDRTD